MRAKVPEGLQKSQKALVLLLSEPINRFQMGNNILKSIVWRTGSQCCDARTGPARVCLAGEVQGWKRRIQVESEDKTFLSSTPECAAFILWGGMFLKCHQMFQEH